MLLPAVVPIQAILADPDRLSQAVDTYFATTIPNGTKELAHNGNHPTPEGLCISLGIPGFTALKSLLSDQEQVSKLHPGSLHTLLTAFSTLQDYYIKHALSTKISSVMAKFLSNAYFNIRETSQAVRDSTTTENKTITIRVESSRPSTPQEAKEIDRLAAHVAEQASIERIALGMEPPRDGPESKPNVSLEDVL